MDKKQNYAKDIENKELTKEEELENVKEAFLQEGIGGEELAYIMRRWEK